MASNLLGMWANTDYYTPTNMRHNVPCQDSRGFVNLRGGVVLPVPCEAATVVCNQLCCLLYLYNIYIYTYLCWLLCGYQQVPAQLLARGWLETLLKEGLDAI